MEGTGKVVKFLKRKIWIESGLMGDQHVVVQDVGCGEPFTYATFHYDYRYTCNAAIHQQAESLAKALGAKEPIERRGRKFEVPECIKNNSGIETE